MLKYLLAVVVVILAFESGFGQFSLVSTYPGRNSSNVSINQAIVLQFSDDVNSFTSSNDFSIISNLRGKVECTFSVSGSALTIVPLATLLFGEKITVTIFKTLKSVSYVPLVASVNFQFLVESKLSPRTPPALVSKDIISSTGIITMIEAADMDSDGDLDIVAYYGPDLVWLENNGNEEFSKHTIKAGVSFPYFIKPFDIDLDGDLDLMASAHNSGLMIFENDGSQNFQQIVTIAGYAISSFDVADFDSNGYYDIVYSSVEQISGNYVNGTYILFNQGAYTYNKVELSTTTFYNFFSVDLDNDNDWDIVHYDDAGIYYWLNTEGTFTKNTIFSEDNTTYERVLIADINNDNNQDILFFKYHYSTKSLEALLNNGSLQFTSSKIEDPSIIELSSVADYDGDGDQDIMIMDWNYTYSMLVNSGSMSFTKETTAYPLSGIYYPTNSITADFDRDGDLDFLACPNSTIKLYENTQFPFDIKNQPQINMAAVDSDWGDYDNDGDLDLVMIGEYGSAQSVRIFENENGELVEKLANLANLWMGSCDWGDFDNDGDLDLLITGSSDLVPDDRSPKSLIYTNNNGEFTLLSSSDEQLPKIWFGKARWADFNNDGLLDIVFNGAYYAGVYKGDGQGNFVKQFDFPFSASWANVDVGDFDNDEDLDIAVSGYTGGAIVSIFRNDGDWEFSAVSGNFVGRFGGNVSWSDMDNDGDLDLLASGMTRNDWGNAVPSITVYQNNGNSFSALENSQLLYHADEEGTTVVGDYDNDGVPDVVASTSGGSSYAPDMSLFINNGTGDLKYKAVELPNVASRALNWIDIDQDHDLDLFVSPRMLINNISKKNTKPAPPTIIEVDSIYNNSIYFSWGYGQDAETPAAGLTYQLYLSTESGKQNVVNSNSHLNDGLRKVAESGRWKGLNATVKNLFGGNYFFGIQSIDPAFEGSVFSDESQVFVIGIHGSEGACQGLDYSYIAEPAGAYQWEVNGGTIIAGQGTDSLIVHWNSIGVGYVKVSNSQGDRNTLPIKIDEIPNPVIGGDVTVCTGLEIYTNNDPLSHHATWMVSGENQVTSGSAHSGTIQWLLQGQFEVIVQAFPEHKGCSAYDTLLVDIDQRPNTTITGSDNTCMDQVEKYSTELTGAQWEVLNGTIDSTASHFVDVKWTAEGIGDVILSKESSRAYCRSVDSLLITIKPSPLKPILTIFQDTIVLSTPSPTDYYQWYYEGQLVISGPYIGVVPFPGADGAIVVEVFGQNGCGRKSDPFFFIVTGIEEPAFAENNLRLYPNPVDKKINVELIDHYLGSMKVQIYSSSGGLAKEVTILKTGELLHQEIDVSELANGYYILFAKTLNSFYSVRFIKL